MSYARTAVTSVVAALVLSLVLTLAASSVAHAHHPVGKRVALSDARVAPDYLRALKPGRSVTVTRQCGRNGFWSEVSAYRGRGGALGGQQWNRDHDLTFWRAPYGGRVTFDGITFRNATSRAVLVGGWCG